MRPLRLIAFAGTLLFHDALLDTAAARSSVPQPTRRDSAGVRIIEYVSVRGAVEAFSIQPASTITMGVPGTDPAEEFNASHPFIHALPLRDGRWVAADWDHLKLFDAEGHFLKRFGRRGRGPGEFGQLLKICRLADESILAVDYGDRRFSVWNDDGTLRRAHASIPFLWVDPCFKDGTLLTIQAPDGQSPGFLSNGRAHFARVNADGSLVAQLGIFPMPQMGEAIPRVVSLMPRGDQLVVADGLRWEVRWFSSTGTLQRSLRVTGDRKPLTSAEWAYFIDMQPPQVRARFGAQERPEFLPAFGRLESDDTGRLWVQDYSDKKRWTVFDSTGALLGAASVPQLGTKGTELSGIFGDRVLLRHQDPDGFMLLSVHRLVRVTRP